MADAVQDDVGGFPKAPLMGGCIIDPTFDVHFIRGSHPCNLRGCGVVLAEEPIHGSFPEILVRQEQAGRKQVVYRLLVGTGVWWLSGCVGQPGDEQTLLHVRGV